LYKKTIIVMFMRINQIFSTSCIVLCMLLLPTLNMQAEIYYDYAGGVYYQPNNDGRTAAIANPNGDGNYQGTIIIPESITDNAGTTYTVTSILGSAFANSPELISVSIPKTVNQIGAWAFRNCPNLKKITINGGIASIGNDLFYGTNIELLILGKDVTSIKNLGVNPSTILSNAVTPPECDENTFTGYDAVLTVPNEGYDNYLVADYWKNFFVADSISLNEENVSLYVGDTHTLIATVFSVNMKDPRVGWTSSNKRIARVDANGNITAVNVGECDITVTCQNVSATCHVTVLPIPPQSITLNSEHENVYIGDTFQLVATILPENTTDKTVTWSSDDESIATVDENGLVTAVSLGECIITAICQNVSNKCHITVLTVSPESITISAEDESMFVGETLQLVATVLPENIDDKTVTWSSSNAAIATVDENGLVTAVAVGECDITARCQNVFATCHITVKPILPESITLNATEQSLTIGETFQLRATVLPENTTDKTVTWSSSDENIATVDKHGLVTALAFGECEITATCQDVSATCHITVRPILPQSIILNADEASLLIGETIELTATVRPENTTDKTVTWSSSNVNIATVDANGLVTAVGVGECDITATCQNVSATCHITVLPILPQSIILNSNNESLHIAETVQLTATVMPESTIDKTVTWSSSDASVATVNANGLVTAVGVGECGITATCQNVSATCHITVLPILAESITLNFDSTMVKEGNIVQLNATILPENTTDKTVTWSSSDKRIAIVDSNGLVTTLAPGECDITSTCSTVNDICHISVIDPADITIQIEAPQISSCLQNKASINITMDPIPTELRAESSDTTVAVVQIEDNILTIEGLGIGYADIIIGSQDGISQSDTCQVSIYTYIGDANANGTTTVADVTSIIDHLLTGQPYDYLADVNGDGRVAIDDVTALVDMLLTGSADGTLIAPQSIELDVNEVEIPVGSNYSLTATVVPEDVYNSVISWESSNRAVATVNDGVITAKGVGSCDIIAKCYNVESVCHVTVYEIKPESVTLNHVNEQMNVGEQLTLTATVYPSNVTNPTVTWTSTNRAVATVTNGVVKAIGVGECDIIATCQDKQATCHISVVAITPDSIVLNHVNEQMHVGEQLTLTATVYPSNVNNPTVTWSSSNKNIAKVTNGVVTAVAIGECDIIATCQNIQAICHISVVAITPDSIVLDHVNEQMNVGEQLTLTATVYPSNVTNPTVTWATTNRAVATVTNGVVKAIGVGECDIKATCQDKQATCHITVVAITPDSIVLNHVNEQMHVGEQLTLTATVYPSNVTNPTITWSSSNKNIAKVSNGVVTAVAIGECNITATCQGKQATCHISVVAVLPESISLNYTNKRLNVGDKLTLVATVSPSNVTNPTVTWASTNQSVATVSNGVVTAVAVGECDIRATCQNVSATCHITVQGAATSGEITVNGVTFVMVPVQGGSFTMGISIQGDASTDNKIQHQVTLSDFAIGQTEVTQELWVAVMGHNPSLNKDNLQYPVEYVTWNDCQNFIASLNNLTGLNFRLPTEAEWEYAARGGQLSQGYRFSGSNTLYNVAWCNGNSGGSIHPVGQLAPNELGLYDMTGNVKEWTNDWYDYYTSAAQTNPTGPATGSWKVFRGGSFDSKAAECYVTKRASREVSFHNNNLGLRLVLVP
jgi:uncharacterized protein YjdB